MSWAIFSLWRLRWLKWMLCIHWPRTTRCHTFTHESMGNTVNKHGTHSSQVCSSKCNLPVTMTTLRVWPLTCLPSFLPFSHSKRYYEDSPIVKKIKIEQKVKLILPTLFSYPTPFLPFLGVWMVLSNLYLCIYTLIHVHKEIQNWSLILLKWDHIVDIILQLA